MQIDFGDIVRQGRFIPRVKPFLLISLATLFVATMQVIGARNIQISHSNVTCTVAGDPVVGTMDIAVPLSCQVNGEARRITTNYAPAVVMVLKDGHQTLRCNIKGTGALRDCAPG